jgi:hypothetical protein
MPATYSYTLSSGLFQIPQNAASVDWAVVNDATSAQTFVVTVYKAVLGAAKQLLMYAGATETLNAGVSTHSANPVGAGKTFDPGFYYEVVLQSNDKAVLPTVAAWDSGGRVVAGTRVGAGEFVSIS